MHQGEFNDGEIVSFIRDRTKHPVDFALLHSFIP